jgi:hypothetical protein
MKIDTSLLDKGCMRIDRWKLDNFPQRTLNMIPYHH